MYIIKGSKINIAHIQEANFHLVVIHKKPAGVNHGSSSKFYTDEAELYSQINLSASFNAGNLFRKAPKDAVCIEAIQKVSVLPVHDASIFP